MALKLESFPSNATLEPLAENAGDWSWHLLHVSLATEVHPKNGFNCMFSFILASILSPPSVGSLGQKLDCKLLGIGTCFMLCPLHKAMYTNGVIQNNCSHRNNKNIKQAYTENRPVVQPIQYCLTWWAVTPQGFLRLPATQKQLAKDLTWELLHLKPYGSIAKTNV